MNYYLVFNQSGKFRGYLTHEHDVTLFKDQRKHNDYNIVKVKESKFAEKFPNLDLSFHEAMYYNEFIMFPDEEEYFIESFEQFIQDLDHTIIRGLPERLAPIRFTDKEYEIVNKFRTVVSDMVCEYIEANEDMVDDMVEPSDYFKIDQMIKDLLSNF